MLITPMTASFGIGFSLELKTAASVPLRLLHSAIIFSCNILCYKQTHIRATCCPSDVIWTGTVRVHRGIRISNKINDVSEDSMKVINNWAFTWMHFCVFLGCIRTCMCTSKSVWRRVHVLPGSIPTYLNHDRSFVSLPRVEVNFLASSESAGFLCLSLSFCLSLVRTAHPLLGAGGCSAFS